ncbi:MAG: nicotinate (nicotinamide) nucleotide adenylyltransferase [Candidatus Cryptobacteroides sp.]
MTQTAIYPGSFNPLHKGHLAILTRLLDDFNSIQLIVSPRNPLKPTATPADALQRLEAARQAVSRHPELNGKVTVSDIEFRIGEPNYTIRTLDTLKSEIPDSTLWLVIGGDQLSDFRRWKDYSRILLDHGICVFPRKGYDLPALAASLQEENPAYRIRLMDMPLVDVSSTQIRNALAHGEDPSSLLM